MSEKEIPTFANHFDGEADENPQDERDILKDQDQTLSGELLIDDENMGARYRGLEAIEDEPIEFIQGDVDVQEQMKRAANAMDAALNGYQREDQDDIILDENDGTPGGIEEVIEKTDQFLATHQGERQEAISRSQPFLGSLLR